MHGLSKRFSRRSIFPEEHVPSIWKGEHPQCSGRPMRLRLLRVFLTYARSCPDLWTANGAAVAANYEAHESGAAARCG